jgi:hypothetical protein
MNAAKPKLEALESRVAPATFTVNSTAESWTGSLREALTKADVLPGADKIVFKLPAPPPHTVNVILLGGTELPSKGNVTIIGPGRGKLIIDANNASRVLDINDDDGNADSPATISGLSMIRGQSGGFGGGLYSSESLTLKDVVVSQCSSNNGGGGGCSPGRSEGTNQQFARHQQQLKWSWRRSRIVRRRRNLDSADNRDRQHCRPNGRRCLSRHIPLRDRHNHDRLYGRRQHGPDRRRIDGE